MAHTERKEGLRPPDPLGTGSIFVTMPENKAPSNVESPSTNDHAAMAEDVAYEPMPSFPEQSPMSLTADNSAGEARPSAPGEAPSTDYGSLGFPIELAGGRGGTHPPGLPAYHMIDTRGDASPTDAVMGEAAPHRDAAGHPIHPSKGSTPYEVTGGVNTSSPPQSLESIAAPPRVSERVGEDAAEAIDALKSELTELAYGYANYYMGERDLVVRSEGSVAVGATELRSAVSIIVALLDLGCSPNSAYAWAGLDRASWFRLA